MKICVRQLITNQSPPVIREEKLINTHIHAKILVDVNEALTILDTDRRKAKGQDGVPRWMLRECHNNNHGQCNILLILF